MEFNEKLQELRKEKNFTQDELAKELFVSRTAVSKWESGRGYPNIDSLREISKFFSVSLDDLLSSDEIISAAQEDNKNKISHFRDIVFGLLDCCVAMFLFLPFFGQTVNGIIQEVSLLELVEIRAYTKTIYFVLVFACILCGIITLCLQNFSANFWRKNKAKISVIISSVSVLFFMASTQPYAAIFTFVFLAIKVLILIKWE